MNFYLAQNQIASRINNKKYEKNNFTHIGSLREHAVCICAKQIFGGRSSSNGNGYPMERKT